MTETDFWSIAIKVISAAFMGALTVLLGRNFVSRSNRALSSDKAAVADDSADIKASVARGTLIDELVKQSQAAWKQVDAIKDLHVATLDEMSDIRKENVEIRKENALLKTDNEELRELHSRCETETNQLRAAHGVEIAALQDEVQTLKAGYNVLLAKVDKASDDLMTAATGIHS